MSKEEFQLGNVEKQTLCSHFRSTLLAILFVCSMLLSFPPSSLAIPELFDSEILELDVGSSPMTCSDQEGFITSEIIQTYRDFGQAKIEIRNDCDPAMGRECLRTELRRMEGYVIQASRLQLADEIFALVRLSVLEYLHALSIWTPHQKDLLGKIRYYVSQSSISIFAPKDSPYYGLSPVYRPSFYVENVLHPDKIVEIPSYSGASRSKVHPEGALTLLAIKNGGDLVFAFKVIRSLLLTISPRYFYLNEKFEFHPNKHLLGCLSSTGVVEWEKWDESCLADQVKKMRGAPGSRYEEALRFEELVKSNPYVSHRIPDFMVESVGICRQGQVESVFIEWLATYIFYTFFFKNYVAAYGDTSLNKFKTALESSHCADSKIAFDRDLVLEEGLRQYRHEVLNASRLLPVKSLKRIAQPMFKYFNTRHEAGINEASQPQKVCGDLD